MLETLHRLADLPTGELLDTCFSSGSFWRTISSMKPTHKVMHLLG